MYSSKTFVFILIFLRFFIFSIPAYSQLLHWPESIVYDSLYNRYLVSNYYTGSIVQIDKEGIQSPFVNNMNATQGLAIVDSIVYCGCDSTVRGFRLSDGEQVMNLWVYGVNNLNDVTSDNDGYLYVTDVYGTKIIKVYPQTQTYSVFVQGNGIYNPNGIIFDEDNNRLLVCSYRPNFPIQAISLTDSTVITLLETELDNSDGITIDEIGNVYVTSWETNAIYKIEPDFSNPPELVYYSAGGPADISYDEVNSVIAIPLQNYNSVDFLPITYTEIQEGLYKNDDLINIDVFPNPFTFLTNIKFEIRKSSHINLKIIDSQGKTIKLLHSGILNNGSYSFQWDGKVFSATHSANGLYYCILQVDNRTLTKSIIFKHLK